MAGKVIGIDLGTANLVVAVMDGEVVDAEYETAG